jgi:hypothetical protein
VNAKRPHASEGPLGLPRRAGPRREAGERRLVTAEDDAFAALGLRRGDGALFDARTQPEHGDLVAWRAGPGPLRLWRAWPEARCLRLTHGEEHVELPPGAAVEGVVVAFLRRFAGAP